MSEVARECGETAKERSVTPALLFQRYVQRRNEPINYNATTDAALARPTGSGWPCKYYIRTKESIRNVSCELSTQYYSPATENLQSENLFLNHNLVFTVQEETIVTLATLITAS
jgi:hypothetical protein